MSRYIDADEAVTVIALQMPFVFVIQGFEDNKRTAQRIIGSISSIDIVRCKECKHAHMTYGGDCKYCDMWKDDDDFCIELYLDGDFYCAYGERKESE